MRSYNYYSFWSTWSSIYINSQGEFFYKKKDFNYLPGNRVYTKNDKRSMLNSSLRLLKDLISLDTELHFILKIQKPPF